MILTSRVRIPEEQQQRGALCAANTAEVILDGSGRGLQTRGRLIPQQFDSASTADLFFFSPCRHNTQQKGIPLALAQDFISQTPIQSLCMHNHLVGIDMVIDLNSILIFWQVFLLDITLTSLTLSCTRKSKSQEAVRVIINRSPQNHTANTTCKILLGTGYPRIPAAGYPHSLL